MGKSLSGVSKYYAKEISGAIQDKYHISLKTVSRRLLSTLGNLFFGFTLKFNLSKNIIIHGCCSYSAKTRAIS